MSGTRFNDALWGRFIQERRSWGFWGSYNEGWSWGLLFSFHLWSCLHPAPDMRTRAQPQGSKAGAQPSECEVCPLCVPLIRMSHFLRREYRASWDLHQETNETLAQKIWFWCLFGWFCSPCHWVCSVIGVWVSDSLALVWRSQWGCKKKCILNKNICWAQWYRETKHFLMKVWSILQAGQIRQQRLLMTCSRSDRKWGGELILFPITPSLCPR